MKFLQYFSAWVIWDGQGDTFTKKFLSAEGVFLPMHFLLAWTREGDEANKELKQLIRNTGKKKKQCDFSCVTLGF